jgi:hypothetical protein
MRTECRVARAGAARSENLGTGITNPATATDGVQACVGQGTAASDRPSPWQAEGFEAEDAPPLPPDPPPPPENAIQTSGLRGWDCPGGFPAVGSAQQYLRSAALYTSVDRGWNDVGAFPADGIPQSGHNAHNASHEGGAHHWSTSREAQASLSSPCEAFGAVT